MISCFSHAVSTNRTNVAIGHIKASLAEFYFTTHLADHFTELYDVIVICLRRCNTKRRAVFLPMPGSLANSLTAFSRSEEENCI
jgi:hypothetical protein